MHVKVPSPYLFVMTTVEMFDEVVSNIFLTRMLLKVKISLLDLVCGPKKSHFYGSRALLLDGVICYAYCCEIVTVYWCRWLCMS